MPKLVLQSNLIKGVKRGFFGWSITNILTVTSVVVVLLSAFVQYFVLSSLSQAFRKVYEQEASGKLVAQVEAFRPRILRSLQAENTSSLSAIASEALQLDVSYQLIIFYDEKGRLVSFFQRDSVPRNLIASLNRVANLRVLPRAQEMKKKNYDVTVLDAREQRTMDAVLAVDLKSDFSSGGPTSRVGFVRLLASLERVDEQLHQLRYLGIILVIVTTALATFLFLLVIRKTVTNPIERAVRLVEFVVENVERVPALELKQTDALQVKQLMLALHSGLSEVSLRHRTSSILADSRRFIEHANEKNLLPGLRNIWLKSRLALRCHLVLARQSAETQRFHIERATLMDGDSPESIVGNLPHRGGGQRFEMEKELVTETVLKFLSQSQEIDWTENWLLVKIPFQVLSDGHVLVLSIVPNGSTGVTPDRFEELSLTWITEVARLYQEVRYRSIAGEFEIARELQRKWILLEGKPEAREALALDAVFACDSVAGQQAMGDFLFACRLPQRMCSVALVGSVSSVDFRGGLAATGIVAAVSDRFQSVRTADPQRILKGLLSSVNTYLWSLYKGEICASTMAIFFDHDKGMGFFSSYGLKFPLLLTPHERKPMIITQPESCSPLGSTESLNFVSTSFPVYAGQLVFASTSGFMEIENDLGQRFEKPLVSGALSEAVDSCYTEPAKVVLQRFFDAARDFAGSRVINRDLTGVLFMRRPLDGNVSDDSQTER